MYREFQKCIRNKWIFYDYCLNPFSFPVNRISIPEEEKEKKLNMEF